MRTYRVVYQICPKHGKGIDVYAHKHGVDNWYTVLRGCCDDAHRNHNWKDFEYVCPEGNLFVFDESREP